jgi:hypothetical protein
MNSELDLPPKLAHSNWINMLDECAYNADSEYVIISGIKGSPHEIYDMRTGERLITLKQNKSYNQKIIKIDEKTLLVNTVNSLEIYDLTSKTRVKEISVDPKLGWVQAKKYDGKRRVYCIGSVLANSLQYIFYVDIYACKVSLLRRVEGQSATLANLVCMSDGRHIIAMSQKGHIMKIDTLTGECYRVVHVQACDEVIGIAVIHETSEIAFWDKKGGRINILDAELKTIRKRIYIDRIHDDMYQRQYADEKILSVVFSDNAKYVCFVYATGNYTGTHVDEDAFATIVEVETETSVAGLDGDSRVELSDEFAGQLKKFGFSENAAEEIGKQFKFASILAHEDHGSSKLCAYADKLLFGRWRGDELCLFDLQQMEVDTVVYSDKRIRQFSLHAHNILIDAKDGYDYPRQFPVIRSIHNDGSAYQLKHDGECLHCRYASAVYTRKDYHQSYSRPYEYNIDYTAVSESGRIEQFYHVSAASDINETYLVAASDNGWQVHVRNRKTGAKWFAIVRGHEIESVKATAEANVFFITDREYNVWKYEISDEQKIVQTSLKWKLYTYKDCMFVRSDDGRDYVVRVLNCEHNISVTGAKTGERLCVRQIDWGARAYLLGAECNGKYVLVYIAGARGYQYLFLDIKTLDIIARMYMLSKQRFLIETPPDEGAPHGWFYTNAPELVNVFIESKDGRAQLLKTDDARRKRYIDTYNRKDMVINRLFKPEKYACNMERLKEGKEIQQAQRLLQQQLLLGSGGEDGQEKQPSESA